MRILRDGVYFSECGDILMLAAITGEDADRYSYHHDDVAASLIDKNNAAFEQAMDSLTAGYPPSEISSWERQRAEAVAWGANDQALTPWIDIAAQVRGIDRAEYLGRTLAKVQLFAQASAYLVGKRQALDDAIRQAETVAELEAITIDYSLPTAP